MTHLFLTALCILVLLAPAAQAEDVAPHADTRRSSDPYNSGQADEGFRYENRDGTRDVYNPTTRTWQYGFEGREPNSGAADVYIEQPGIPSVPEDAWEVVPDGKDLDGDGSD